MAQPSWLPDDSTLVAISNLLLLLLLIVVTTRSNWWRRRARRASRKLLVAQRRSKGLQYALNITVNQYHALRRKLGRGPRPGIALTPAAVALDPPRQRMIVPPPLDLAPAVGEDPSSWQDSGVLSSVLPRPAPLRPDDTQTRPIHPDAELLRKSRPPSARTPK